MSLRDQYSVTATVKRRVITGNKSNYTAQSTIKGHKQPLDSAYAALIDGDISKSFSFWVDVDADVKEGDQLTISSVIYYVKEEKLFDIGSRSQQHKELVIERKDV